MNKVSKRTNKYVWSLRALSGLVLLLLLGGCLGQPTNPPEQVVVVVTATFQPTSPGLAETSPSQTPQLAVTGTTVTEGSPVATSTVLPVPTMHTPTPTTVYATPLPNTGTSDQVQPPYRGFSFASWWKDTLSKPESVQSLKALSETGANMVAIPVTQYLENVNGVEIIPTNNTAEDAGVVQMLGAAKNLGLARMLKPHLNVVSGEWSANIGRDMSPEQRAEWFKNYTQFVLYYARMAQEQQVELFSVGNELTTMSAYKAEWQALIAEVRQVYTGTITYTADRNEAPQIQWWDAVDVIGINAYYPLALKDNSSPEEMIANFSNALVELEGMYLIWGKPVLITEIGFRSIKGSSKAPWDYQENGEVNVEEQEQAYLAVLSALQKVENEPWYYGVIWWFWDPRADRQGPNDRDFTPRGKPAEEVLKSFWLP
jgi:hypothetical protein